MKRIVCPLCENLEYKILHKSTLTNNDFNPESIANNLKNTLDDYKKHGQIVKCIRCGLVYVNPQEDLVRFTKGYEQVVDEEYLKTDKYRKILSQNHLRTIQKHKSGGKILDVGCFAGFFLELAKNAGWDTYGIEPSLWAKKVAEKRKIKIIGKDIEKITLNADYFDAVTLWDVIEHLQNPHRTISKIHSSLKKGGIIAMGTPNIESLFAQVLGSNCPFLVRMHVILYSPKTLALFLKIHGFEVVGIYSYSRTFPFGYFLDRLQMDNVFFHTFKRLLRRITFLMNLQITLPFRESFVIIGQKQ